MTSQGAGSTPRVSLRPFTPDEYAEYRATAVEEYADELVRAYAIDREWADARSAESFPTTLSEATQGEHVHLCRVVTAEGEDAGTLWLSPSTDRPGRLSVYDIQIHEPFRGRGLGRATMLAAEQVARDAGFPLMELSVFGWNTRARALYESLGYVPQSIRMRKQVGEAS